MELEKFIEQFALQFDDTDPSEIASDTNFKDIEEWSSMVALSVIAMVDEEYNLKLTGEDIRSSSTVNELFERVKAKKN